MTTAARRTAGDERACTDAGRRAGRTAARPRAWVACMPQGRAAARSMAASAVQATAHAAEGSRQRRSASGVEKDGASTLAIAIAASSGSTSAVSHREGAGARGPQVGRGAHVDSSHTTARPEVRVSDGPARAGGGILQRPSRWRSSARVAVPFVRAESLAAAAPPIKTHDGNVRRAARPASREPPLPRCRRPGWALGCAGSRELF